MSRLSLLPRLLSKGTFAASMVLGASEGSAGEFYAMFSSFGLNADRSMTAQVKVGFETSGVPEGTNILFTVYDATGLRRGEFVVPVNDAGFASTADAAPPNDNLLRGPTNAFGTAWLEQRQARGRLKGRVVMAIPDIVEFGGQGLAIGTAFVLPLDDVKAAALLITNPSGGDIRVDVFHGTRGAPGAGIYNHPGLGEHAVWRVDLQPSDEKKTLFINASAPILVQVMIDDGRVFGLTSVPIG
jgi:hypothetical protein